MMYELSIDQAFNVPVAELFSAWVNPQTIQKWFAPGNMKVPEASCELNEGASYRIVMQDEQGEQFIVTGKYIEIVNNERLVFTWKWQHGVNTTQVEVTFKAIDDHRSRLVLHHKEFVEQEHCDNHYDGWLGCLENLSKITT